jgi:hypothetical protein
MNSTRTVKRIALLLVVGLLASTGCASMTKGGAHGPQIQRTTDSQPSQTDNTGALDGRPELGQR